MPVIVLLAVLIDQPENRIRQNDYVWERSLEARKLQSEAGALRESGRRSAAAARVVRSIVTTPYLHELRVLANLPYGSKGVLAEACIQLKKQAQISHDPAILFDLGFLLIETGQYEEARKIFLVLHNSGMEFSRWNYCSPEPSYYLGRISHATGNLPSALRSYKDALANRPGDLESLAHVAVLLEQMGNKKDSEFYRNQLFAYYDEIDASFFLGKAYWDSAIYDTSAKYFEQVTKWLPDYRKAHLYAFLSLGWNGQVQEALQHYQQAMSISEDFLLPEAPILSVFHRNLEQNQNSAWAHYVIGVAYRQYGHFRLAEEFQRKAIQLRPDYEPALTEMRSLSRVLP